MKKIINANVLKLLAVIFMLSDHLWATIVPGNQWMTWIGRLAFPIFAFQIAEGYHYTSNFKKYAQRLFIFALISEIPFNLFYSSSIFYPFHQNVMFTLLFGLLAVNSIDKARKDPNYKNYTIGILKVIGFYLLARITLVDYGGMGVLTVLAFYLFRDLKWAWLGQFISLILLNMVFYTGMYIPITILGYTFDFTVQGFAVLALIPIWLYNGEKGRSNPVFQYSMYAFYPIHMLVLYILFNL